MLYQLSYSHHVPPNGYPRGATAHDSRHGGTGVDRVARRAGHSTGLAAITSAAIAFAVSTSGPGGGTKIARR